jgi:hypothetical protein
MLSTFFIQILSTLGRHYNGQKHAVVGDDPCFPVMHGELESQSIAVWISTEDELVLGRVFGIAHPQAPDGVHEELLVRLVEIDSIGMDGVVGADDWAGER